MPARSHRDQNVFRKRLKIPPEMNGARPAQSGIIGRACSSHK